MIIEILSGAKKDFLEGVQFYEKQSEGLGRYFYDSLMSDIESLHLYAGVHARQYGFYRMIARRFPYAIYYQIENQIVQIHAVLDCRRNSEWTKKRLTRKL